MARDFGVNDKTLHALVVEGFLRRPIRGVYVAAQVPESLELRCWMLTLVLPPDAFVCDRTAAWLHAGPRALGPNEHLAPPPISCFRPSDCGRLRNKLTDSGEREVRERDLMLIHGVLVTTPLRTALDLGRLQKTRDLKMHGMDTMLSLGVFTLDELLAEIPRFNRRRGVVQLRHLAPLADPGSQSMGETALRLRWLDGGLPKPETQIPVVLDGRIVFYLDMGLVELLFAAEYDGEEWHGPDQEDADLDRRDWLDRNRRWAIEVFRRDNVFGPRQDADLRLARAFAAARASLGTRTYIV
ncbi:hypothetical protein [Nocardioides sp.]|uniref:hypothetical protein n=1 Tax=Nocardioides sp. TaxID=35761 RepID=UPI002ED7CB4D